MQDNGSFCLVTVCEKDYKINEPTPFSSKWLSYKINHAGLRYEIAICIQTGWIVWVNGPYAPGHWPDHTIAADGINDALDRGELYLADGKYRDAEIANGLNHADQRMSIASARHKRVNGLLKSFGCLRRCFRHHRTLHGRLFMAVANVVQATIMLEG